MGGCVCVCGRGGYRFVLLPRACARARGVSDGEEAEEVVGLGGSPAVWPYAPAFSCLFSMADQRPHLH